MKRFLALASLAAAAFTFSNCATKPACCAGSASGAAQTCCATKTAGAPAACCAAKKH